MLKFNTLEWTKQVGKWGGLDGKTANSGRLDVQFESFERHFRVVLLALSGFSCGSEVWELTLPHHETAVFSTQNRHSKRRVWKTRPLRAVGRIHNNRRNRLSFRRIAYCADFCEFLAYFALTSSLFDCNEILQARLSNNFLIVKNRKASSRCRT